MYGPPAVRPKLVPPWYCKHGSRINMKKKKNFIVYEQFDKLQYSTNHIVILESATQLVKASNGEG